MADASTPITFDFAEQPPGVVATQRANLGIFWLFAWPPTRALWEVAIAVAVTLAISVPVRSGMSWWGDVLTVVSLMGLYLAAGFLQIRFYRSTAGSRITNGKFRFPQFDLFPLRIFRFYGRCIKTLVIDMGPEEKIVRGVGKSDLIAIEATFKDRYLKSGADISNWNQTWAAIREVQLADGVTLSEAVGSGRQALFALRAMNTSSLISTLVLVFCGGVVALLPGAIRDQDPLHIIQLALVAGITIAAMIFVNFTISLRQVTYLDPDTEFLDSVQRTLLSKAAIEDLAVATEAFRESPTYELLKENAGRRFYPKLDMRKGYVEGVRDYFVRGLVVATIGVSAVWLVLLAVAWLLAVLLSDWEPSSLNDWVLWMSLGICSMPLLLALSVSLGFFVIARLGRFIAILMAGILVAMVPPLLAYALGSSEMRGLWIVSGVATALASTLPLAIAELLKREPSVQSPQPGTAPA